MTLTNDAWYLLKQNDRQRGETYQDYLHGKICQFCGSGRVAQHNAMFNEPRCQACVNEAVQQNFPSMEETQTQLNQAANEGRSPRYQIAGLTPTVQTSGASFPPGFSEDMKSEPFDAAWQLIKAKRKPFHGYNKKKHARTGGLSAKGRAAAKRKTGANLKRPVTKKPSKLKSGGKAAKRRKSFCARMTGVKGPTSKKGKLTPKGAALKRWNC